LTWDNVPLSFMKHFRPTWPIQQHPKCELNLNTEVSFQQSPSAATTCSGEYKRCDNCVLLRVVNFYKIVSKSKNKLDKIVCI